MLIVIYTNILYLSTWTYSTDITTLNALDHQIKNLLRNRFAQFYHNPLADQFQVLNKFLQLNKFLFIVDFYCE
jgi:hypothetical protein